MSLVLILITAATLFLVGANNASNSAGTVAGSKILSYRNGILIFVAGFTAGLLLEGGKLVGSIQGRALQGSLDALSTGIVMGITLAMVAIATFARIPLPISQAVFGASLGSAVYLGIPLNGGYITLVLGSWLMETGTLSSVKSCTVRAPPIWEAKAVGGPRFESPSPIVLETRLPMSMPPAAVAAIANMYPSAVPRSTATMPTIRPRVLAPKT